MDQFTKWLYLFQNCDQDENLDENRRRGAKKILSFMSLSKLRNGGHRRKAAKNATLETSNQLEQAPQASKELRIRKEKPSARKERRATKTLAIVLGE